MRAFAQAAELTVHVHLRYGRSPHHVCEATFKALAKALGDACALTGRGGVPSHEGNAVAAWPHDRRLRLREREPALGRARARTRRRAGTRRRRTPAALGRRGRARDPGRRALRRMRAGAARRRVRATPLRAAVDAGTAGHRRVRRDADPVRGQRRGRRAGPRRAARSRRAACPQPCAVPHMGWNTVAWAGRRHAFAAGIPDDTFFYFVHSFAPDLGDPTRSARREHGRAFSAVVARDNVFATQFHPEKSGEAGLAALRQLRAGGGAHDRDPRDRPARRPRRAPAARRPRRRDLLRRRPGGGRGPLPGGGRAAPARDRPRRGARRRREPRGGARHLRTRS